MHVLLVSVGYSFVLYCAGVGVGGWSLDFRIYLFIYYLYTINKGGNLNIYLSI